MPGTRWIALGLFVAALLAQVLPAQEPPARPSPKTAEELTRALASESPTEVAAAAAAARTSTDKQLVGRLRKTLRAWSEDRHPESNRVRLHLLDALIAQHARLPAAELLPLLEDPLTSMPAFILLCREPKQNQAELMDLFRKLKPGIRRIALGNLLCQQKAPGFAALVWQQTRFDLRVTVRDESSITFDDGSLSFMLPETKVDEGAEGFPREPVYQLQLSPLGGIEVAGAGPPEPLAPGTVTVEFVRWERLDGVFGNPEVEFWLGGCDPLGWLETMAGRRAGPGEDPRSLTLEFTTPEACVNEVVAARQRLTKVRDDLRAALLAAGALTTEQAATTDPVVQVIVEDMRGDRKTPLQRIPDPK